MHVLRQNNIISFSVVSYRLADYLQVLQPPHGNLYNTLSNDGRFNTFIRLIRQAELVDLLQGNDPITILTPTDQVETKSREQTPFH